METKKKIYAIISVFFLISVFLAVFFVYPLLEEIKQESNDLIAQKNNRLLLDSQFNEALNFKQKYDDYKDNLNKIDNLFIDSQNPVNFIEYLEKSALGAGIELKISTPSISKDKKIIYENLQISATGQFSKILKFIREIESGQYLIQIQNINIQNNKIAQTGKTPNKITDIKAEISIKALAK